MSNIYGQLFGSEWTDKKLRCLASYIQQYNKALINQNFGRIYIDAFAGSGFRKNKDDNIFNNEDLNDMTSFSKGSAYKSLETDPSFSKYFFIDIDKKNINSLHDLKDQFPKKDIEIIHGDANVEVDKLCKNINWNNNRGVVFLDPYGMQVNWSTLNTIAQTQSLDCWVLFPIGVAINRLLTKKYKPPQAWQDSITRVLGTDEWEEEFYKIDPQLSLLMIMMM